MNDEYLQQEIQNWLESDVRLSVYGLKASVDRGHVVLQGVVDVLAEKDYAEERLKSIDGVRSIDNALVLCTDGAVDDEDVAFEVSEELRADPAVSDTVGVEVHGGNVRLIGQVKHLAEKNKAVEAAKKARGVVGVESDLKLTDEVPDDATLTNSIVTTLSHDPRVNARNISVLSHDGSIYLSGQVEDETEWKAILENVRLVPGVKAIHTDMNSRLDLPEDIVVAMLDRIATNPYLNREGISFSWDDHQFTIEGAVDSNETKKVLETEVQHLLDEYPHRVPVENRLRVEDD